MNTPKFCPKLALTYLLIVFCLPGGCANISCEFYSVCKSQGVGQPGLCVCPTDCIVEAQDVVITDSEGKKVCGTDGQTYPSECHMKIAACKKYQYIVVANKGDCGKHLTFSSFQFLGKTVIPCLPF